jgi:hypothetical protein
MNNTVPKCPIVTANVALTMAVDKMDTPNASVVAETIIITSSVEVMGTTTTTTTIMDGTIFTMAAMVVVMEMATVVVPCHLSSQMMNALSMVDTNCGSVISTLGKILMLHYMEAVEEVMVITELQDSSITMLSRMVKTILPMPECKGLHFMVEHLEGMLVCMVLKVYNNPTRLAHLFPID